MRQKLSQDMVIDKARKVHGDKYDYSKVEYVAMNQKVAIICPVHGIFYQTPDSHIHGKCGCPSCNKVKTSQDFIDKARKVHGDKYDYSKVEYKGYKQKVTIICPLHGEFQQVPNNHICVRDGCPKCGYIKASNTKTKTLNEFITKAISLHGGRYDYSKTIYNGALNKTTIICPIHGEFQQSPFCHLQGQGCPHCRTSKGELSIRKYLEGHNIYFKTQYRFPDCKDKRSLPFDFYLPEYNMCIEYDGEQHFKPIGRWKGAKGFEDIKRRDNIKNSYCKDNGIGLIRIKYTENDISSILDSVLFG